MTEQELELLPVLLEWFLWSAGVGIALIVLCLIASALPWERLFGE